jgi:hypothetical protein
LRRIEVHQDHFRRVVLSDNRAPREIEERGPIQPREPARPLEVETAHRRQCVTPRVALHDLQCGQRREALQLDQLRHERAVLAHDGKVDLREVRQRVHPGRVPSLRDRALHSFDTRRIGDLREDLACGRDHTRLEIVGEEQRALREPELELTIQT